MTDTRRAPTTLGELHDASVLGVELDWTSGRATLSLRWAPGATGICVLVCENVTRVETTRDAPWGQSTAINVASWTPEGADHGALAIELQSGDVITMTCASVVF